MNIYFNRSTIVKNSLGEVKNNMKLTEYPTDRRLYIKGKVEKTRPKNNPEKISLLRPDTDWYELTYQGGCKKGC